VARKLGRVQEWMGKMMTPGDRMLVWAGGSGVQIGKKPAWPLRRLGKKQRSQVQREIHSLRRLVQNRKGWPGYGECVARGVAVSVAEFVPTRDHQPFSAQTRLRCIIANIPYARINNV
jgi:hypothetical protein